MTYFPFAYLDWTKRIYPKWPISLGNDPKSSCKRSQYKKLAKTIFAGVPGVQVHLEKLQGLKHYIEVLFFQLRHFEEFMIEIFLRIDNLDYDMPPNPNEIEEICSSFKRLAPLLWGYLKNKSGFKNTLIRKAMNKVNFKFCSPITLYNLHCAETQITVQDAILR